MRCVLMCPANNEARDGSDSLTGIKFGESSALMSAWPPGSRTTVIYMGSRVRGLGGQAS